MLLIKSCYYYLYSSMCELTIHYSVAQPIKPRISGNFVWYVFIYAIYRELLYTI